MQYKENVSIHPSVPFLPLIRLRVSRLQSKSQDLPFPGHLLQHFWGNANLLPRQPWDVVSPGCPRTCFRASSWMDMLERLTSEAPRRPPSSSRCRGVEVPLWLTPQWPRFAAISHKGSIKSINQWINVHKILPYWVLENGFMYKHVHKYSKIYFGMN